MMHNLAIALKNAGHLVTGSDDEVFEPSRSDLETHDLLPAQEGWFPDRIDTSIDVVIIGMHAKKDNPELVKAQQLGLNIQSFPEYIRSQGALATLAAASLWTSGKRKARRPSPWMSQARPARGEMLSQVLS